MKDPGRLIRGAALIAAGLAISLLAAQSARAAFTIPPWMDDSFTEENRYLLLWQYFRNGSDTKLNLWTNAGDPFNTADDLFFVPKYDSSGNLTSYQCPWGSRIFSSTYPSACVSDANGNTTGDARPIANALTLHVEDSSSTTGFTDFLYPEDGRQHFVPPIVDLKAFQGFHAPFTMPAAAPTASGINLTVNQKTEFARDLLRYEVMITNNGGSPRKVGARLFINPYQDSIANGVFDANVFLPATREQVTFEKQFSGAQVPGEWQMFDDASGANPAYIVKGIMKGNGATSPSKVVFGNGLDILPWALGKSAYDWVVRPDFELRIADISVLMYWDPITVNPGETKSFVTYFGMGVADHGMSDAYIPTHQGTLEGQGFIGAIQTPFSLGLINGAVDQDQNGAPVSFNANAYFQNEFIFSSPGSFAFAQLPEGLEFSPNSVAARMDLGTVGGVGSQSDEVNGFWQVHPNGLDAGLLPITVTYGNAFQDTARAIRTVNVPQGNLFQLGDEWRMVTFPFTFSGLQSDPAVALGLQPGTFQIVRYNPQASSFNKYEVVSTIEPGKGYWVRMLGTGTTTTRLQNATAVKLGTTDPTGNNNLFATPLQPGWNQVGNPSPYAVAVRDMKFFTIGELGGQLISYDAAVSRGWIRGTLYQYNRKTNAYEPLNRDSIIQPGKGIWIFTNAERNIAWPPPYGVKLSITETS